MYLPIIEAIAADHVRERIERAEQRRRVRQARAAARQPGRRSRREPGIVVELRPATLRAAAPATRFPR